MKYFLIALVFTTMYTTAPVQAANGKIYFPDNAITEDLEVPCRKFNSSLGYKVNDKLSCDVGSFSFNSGEFNNTNGFPSFNDTDLTELTFMTDGYYGIGGADSPSTEDTGVGLGLAGIDIDGGAFGSSVAVEDYLGYQLRVELGFDVSQNTVLTAEYRYLGYDEPDVFNPHGFVFGARFMF